MNLHIGDPCVFCAVPHDQVPSGECPRNMIREPRLEELYSDPRGAMILKGEIRLLIPAYRLLRDQFAVKPASTPNPVEQLLENIRKPNNGFLSPEDANLPMSALCNCERLPNEHETSECYGLRNGQLTDESLQDYADGKFSQDVKHRGQELAKELLEARLILRGFRAKHGLPLDPPRQEI